MKKLKHLLSQELHRLQKHSAAECRGGGTGKSVWVCGEEEEEEQQGRCRGAAGGGPAEGRGAHGEEGWGPPALPCPARGSPGAPSPARASPRR